MRIPKKMLIEDQLKKEMTAAEFEWLMAGLKRTHKDRFLFAQKLYKEKMTKNGVLLKPWTIR